MGSNERYKLTQKMQQMADLIVRAQPARIRFGSEKQFLELLSWGG